MIQASISRDEQGLPFSFVVHNHGESYVCAAVSMLVINTVNSIKALTEATFSCDYNEAAASIALHLQTPRTTPEGHDAGLLLDAMVLGLESVAAQHPADLTLKNYIDGKIQ